MTDTLAPQSVAPEAIRPQESGAALIDGKAAAAALLDGIGARARALAERGIVPGLATVLVGDDPASRVYVAAKGRAAAACAFHSVQHDLPATTSAAELGALVDALDADPAIHGILVQLPLPQHIDAAAMLERVDPAKDADGFHPTNAGLVATGAAARALVPCTPAGALLLIDAAAAALGRPLAGLEAVVVGRSTIVGRPMAQLLLGRDMTVTLAHSRTRDLPAVVARADVVVAAVGRPEMVRGDWIKPGAIVIDVGINRVPAPTPGKTRLVGDVEFAAAAARAGAITPVPGGVGPMTIAMLMANTLRAAERSASRR